MAIRLSFARALHQQGRARVHSIKTLPNCHVTRTGDKLGRWREVCNVDGPEPVLFQIRQRRM